MSNTSSASRRGFLGTVGTAAGAVAVATVAPGLGRARAQERRRRTVDPARNPRREPAPVALPDRPPAADAAVRAYLGDLATGTELAAGTTVESIHGVFGGALPIVLRTAAGGRFQVDLLARDDAMPGIGRTSRVDVYLANRGAGRERSDETHALAALALAGRLDARERAGATPPALLTMSERRARHPQGIFLVTPPV